METDEFQLEMVRNMAELDIKVSHIEATVKHMQLELNVIHEQANKWKGGFIVILAIGGLVGWLASYGHGISKWFK